LTDLFTTEESEHRDRILTNEARLATLALVTSESVLRDFVAFAPSECQKVRKLQWVAHIPSSVYEQEPGLVSREYDLPSKFFYLPNQFWKHKNHLTVLKALARLRSRGVFPNIVCSGDPHDNRDPAYFAQFWQEVSRLGLREQFIYLGVVPREHVYLLMRQCICMLNPTLFEGFGLGVAEASSLGKRQLLSDLPVLREQGPPCALYFSPDDPFDLAEKLEWVSANALPGPDLELEAAARKSLRKRQEAFASDFLRIVHEATKMAGNGRQPG